MDDHKAQGGLPTDAGNGMSDRSGDTRDSQTGLTDTPVGGSHTTDLQDQADTHTPDTGTTFGTGPNDDTRQ
ncbi:hypothetical protein [Deinococcus multiflagellatus]|uniref:Uncharacterized protein n=1 Tax=Deinococcus multiflagellatus TaxID=1656887 RepID=A0ABW1ZHD2_9DEIO|nr:hypothetical protein [Deinococcus multiflagellatus]MBZ9714302.1 hypothetical protein [Deinococcus multiflagellatus]